MFLSYLIRRLLAIVPALFLLSLLIFALKTSMPEGILDRYLNEAQLQSGSSSQSSIDALAREIRKDLKLDLPLFYFSITASILPDSIRSIYPVEKADFYKKLLIRYGHIHAVSNYYRELDKMMVSGDEAQKKVVDDVYFIADETSLKNYFETQHSTASQQLADAFYQMSTEQSVLKGMVPAIRWQGVDNQFHFWLLGILSLDFGYSIVDNAKVISKIGTALGNTLMITVPAVILLVILGLPLGVWLSRGKGWLYRLTTISLFGLDAMPMFWLSLLLIIFFASDTFLNVLPAYGMGGFVGSSVFSLSKVRYLVLPVTALVFSALPYVSMQASKAMRDESGKLYVLSSRAKGLSERRILWVHIFRNSLVPVITIFSEYLTAAFAGSLVVEVIFSIPGMGKLLYDSVLLRDYNVVLAIILMVAFIKMMSNILADISYRLADPSIDY